MKILVTTAHPNLSEHDEPAGALGRLVQPRHYGRIADTAREGWTWAADNDCFQGLDREAYAHLLDVVAGLPGCRFVSVPDVVGDARATHVLFDEWHSEIAGRGLPAALVAQDGIENERIPWEAIDALFIGGSDDFKLGPVAADVAREAKRRDKWVHWGRVNSKKRIRYIADTGAADSFDGSSWAKYRKAVVQKTTGLRKLDQGIGWCRELGSAS